MTCIKEIGISFGVNIGMCISMLLYFYYVAMECNKGCKKETRPAETLECSKSKLWRRRKLKLNQPVYLIR